MLLAHSTRISSSKFRSCVLTVTVITSMVIPMFLVGASEPTRAKNTRPIETRPQNAPPEPFVMPGEKRGWESLGDRLSGLGSEVARLFATRTSQSASNGQTPDGQSQEVQLDQSRKTDEVEATVDEERSPLNEPTEKVAGESTNSDTEDKTEETAPATMFTQPAGTVDFDFDGDGKSDVGRWHPTTKEFKVKNSTGGAVWTVTFNSLSPEVSSSAKPAPADYDYDGKTDVAIFDSGSWYIRKSSQSSPSTDPVFGCGTCSSSDVTISFGQAGDIPVSGNYRTVNSADELAYFRPSNSTWYWRELGSGTVYTHGWGASGDIPSPGDYDADTLMDPTIYRPSAGQFWIDYSNSSYTYVYWGISIDIPVSADYDGDGKTDPAIYRPTDGAWWYLKSSSAYSTYGSIAWGNPGDQPFVGDFDGDAEADFGVFRPNTGRWHIYQSDSGTPTAHSLGQSGDTPVPSSYLKPTGGTTADVFNAERLQPRNATGGTDLYSQNFGWSRGLVSLPGRSGMDLNLGVSYNSLVWTKVGSAMVFNPDWNTMISPGFNIGFPVIEPTYLNSTTDAYNYLMITPGGSRIEFRQTEGASNVYETYDSSYAQLTTTGASHPNDPVESITIKVVTTDGTQMSYEWEAGAFRCKQIKDRNGNYISIAYDPDDQGQIIEVTDTLGRDVNFNYSNGYLSTITQTWKGDNGSGSNTTHTYATFTYTNKTIAYDFHDSLTPWGLLNGTDLKVVDKITYADGSFTKFHYNGYGQVWKVEEHAADSAGTAHVLNHVRTNIETPSADQTDVPRFTQVWNKVENFNSGNETTATITRTTGHSYTSPAGGSAFTTTKIEVEMSSHPHNAVSKSYYGESSWKDGLQLATEDWADGTSGSERKRWTLSNFTQDDTGVSYQTNPRVIESKVGDGTNTKRTTIDYELYDESTVAAFGLPSVVKVYDTDLTSVLKQSTTTYNFDSNLISRRIAGLPLSIEVEGYNQLTPGLELVSKVTFAYDAGDFSDSGLQQDIEPVQHDSTNYGDSFTYRGNLTSTVRCDVPNCSAPITTSTLKYNTAGSVVSKTTPWDGTNTRTTTVTYDDEVMFNDGVTNRDTYAYPSSITDPGSNSGTMKYRFDIGASVEAKSPAPAGQSYGKKSKWVYDSIGRPQRNSVYVDTTEKSYIRYEYPTNGIQSKVFSTLVDTNANGPDSNDEVLSETWVDGAGRVRMSRVPHTFSSGTPVTWAGALTEYDILGRVKRQSAPTEVDGSWDPTGDDSAFVWRYQKYDWMSRVVRTINTDGTDSPTLNPTDNLVSYAGCGCAGGLQITVEGEEVVEPGTSNLRRRKEKTYTDILGRAWKKETFNWDGSVYSTVVNTYNGRDQVLRTRQYAGTTSSGTYQDTTATFDGHGRIASSHKPEQIDDEDDPTYTVYDYNPDDSILSVEDARGAVTNFEYNSRGLLIEKSWTVPGGSGITDPTDVTFAYDNVGNRISMTDGLGTVEYAYSPLSQLTSELREFNDTLANAPEGDNGYKIEYSYEIGGQLKTLTEPFGAVLNYGYDKVGRLTGVDPAAALGDLPQNSSIVSNMQYRAFGSLTSATYGNGTTMSLAYNNRQQPVEYRVINTSNSDILFGKDYYYTTEANGDNDGMLKSSEHLDDTASTETNEKLNRTNTYDHLGRIKSSDAGIYDWEPFGPGLSNGEFQMDFSYDAFGNLTQTQDRDFNYSVIGCVGCPRTFSYTETISNNRTSTSSFSGSNGVTGQTISNYAFDNDGRPTVRDTDSHSYDATGKRTATSQPNGTPTSVSYAYDGDENLLKMTGSDSDYYIKSSLLNVKLVDLTNTGAAETTYAVTSGGASLGELRGSNFVFGHNDPSGADGKGFKMDKSVTGVTGSGTFDPLGRHRSGGAYTGGGPCSPPGCPGPYNPPGGFDSLGYFKALKDQIRWSHRALFVLDPFIEMGIFVTHDGPPNGWDPYQPDTVMPAKRADGSYEPNDSWHFWFYGGRWLGGMLIGVTEFGHERAYLNWDRSIYALSMEDPMGWDDGNAGSVFFETVEEGVTRCARQMGIEISNFKRSSKGKDGSVSVSFMGDDNVLVAGTIENNVRKFNTTELRQLNISSSDTFGTTFAMGPAQARITDGPTKGRLVDEKVSPWINYTGSNISNSTLILATQVHELGNSIHLLFGKRLGRLTPEKLAVHVGDKDAGAAFEDCVYGGRIDGNGTLQR